MAILDQLFLLFHTALILFVLVGWIWPVLRRAHLLLLILIAISWFGLGICYGIGYCPCTDWHWYVRRTLGHTHLPNSYVKFLLDSWLNLDLDARLVDASALVLFLSVIVISVILNRRDRKKSYRKEK